jgi:hypothetical protein
MRPVNLRPAKVGKRAIFEADKFKLNVNRTCVWKIEGRKANFEASLSSALKMLETLKSATE